MNLVLLQVTFEQCSNWLLRMDSESLPSVETLPSLRAGIAKSGDILYTPPGMIIIDKVVNEDSICV